MKIGTVIVVVCYDHIGGIVGLQQKYSYTTFIG